MRTSFGYLFKFKQLIKIQQSLANNFKTLQTHVHLSNTNSIDFNMAESLRFDTLPKDLKLAENFDVFLCNGYSLPSFAIAFLKQEADHYEAKDDDIYVVSYPKTGII